TAQALLAVMAGMYAVYHGSEGLKQIATNIHQKTAFIAGELQKMGYSILGDNYFDTLWVELPAGLTTQELQGIAEAHKMNFRYLVNDKQLTISVGEPTTEKDLQQLLYVFAELARAKSNENSTITY